MPKPHHIKTYEGGANRTYSARPKASLHPHHLFQPSLRSTRKTTISIISHQVPLRPVKKIPSDRREAE